MMSINWNGPAERARQRGWKPPIRSAPAFFARRLRKASGGGIGAPGGGDASAGTSRPNENALSLKQSGALLNWCFAIMGRVAAAMRDAGIDHTEIVAYRERAMAGDYANLLKVSEGTVDVFFS
jgi:hypothetical protein